MCKEDTYDAAAGAYAELRYRYNETRQESIKKILEKARSMNSGKKAYRDMCVAVTGENELVMPEDLPKKSQKTKIHWCKVSVEDYINLKRELDELKTNNKQQINLNMLIVQQTAQMEHYLSCIRQYDAAVKNVRRDLAGFIKKPDETAMETESDDETPSINLSLNTQEWLQGYDAWTKKIMDCHVTVKDDCGNDTNQGFEVLRQPNSATTPKP